MILKTLPILAAAAGLAAITPAHAQTYYDGPQGYYDQPQGYYDQPQGYYDQPQGYYDEPQAYGPTVGEVVITAPFADSAGRQIKSVPVDFTDLDLNSPAGGYALLGRIRVAARKVCSPASELRNLADTEDFQRCVRRAVDRAVNEVDAPTVQDAFYETGVGTADLPAGG